MVAGGISIVGYGTKINRVAMLLKKSRSVKVWKPHPWTDGLGGGDVTVDKDMKHFTVFIRLVRAFRGMRVRRRLVLLLSRVAASVYGRGGLLFVSTGECEAAA